MSYISITFILFLILDPLGSSQTMERIFKSLAPGRKIWLFLREAFLGLAIVILFNFIGEYLLKLLSISDITVAGAGGLILFLRGLKILHSTGQDAPLDLTEEPVLVPIAVPMIARPSLVATVMLFAHTEPSITLMLLAIVNAMGVGLIFLYLSPQINWLLGPNGRLGLERLMGLILILLAVQRMLTAISLFVTELNLAV